MDEVMSKVSLQIERAINDASSNQVLPQIQNALRSGSGQMTQKGWNVSAKRPECNSDDNPSQKIRSNSRSEPFRSRLYDEDADCIHDILTGDNESPVMFLSFSRDECYQEQLSPKLTMITIHCSIQQYQHKKESHEWPYRSQLID